MNRATDNNHEYFHPNVALTGSQMLLYSPRYTNPQVSRAGAPIVAPHPGTANVGSYNPYIVQDVAGVSAYGGLTAPVDSRGASLLEVSEGTGSGYVFNLNEFSASSAAAGEHTRQQQFPGYTHGVEYVEQSGMGGAFNFCHDRSLCLTIWFYSDAGLSAEAWVGSSAATTVRPSH